MTKEQIDRFIEAVEELGFGSGGTGKGALEALALAIAGPGGPDFAHNNICRSLDNMADSIGDVAYSLELMAKAISNVNK